MSGETFIFRVEQINPFLKSFALRLTQNQVETDDLIQDTLFRAMRNLDKFKDGTNFRAWMATIMKNIFINNYRKKVRRNTVLEGLDDRSVTLIDRHKNAKNDGPSKMVYDKIMNVVNKLQPELKEPFLMNYKGYKYEEIALHLDIPLGTVKSRIFHARRILKKDIEALGLR